jgi:hypothetical protein
MKKPLSAAGRHSIVQTEGAQWLFFVVKSLAHRSNVQPAVVSHLHGSAIQRTEPKRAKLRVASWHHSLTHQTCGITYPHDEIFADEFRFEAALPGRSAQASKPAAISRFEATSWTTLHVVNRIPVSALVDKDKFPKTHRHLSIPASHHAPAC